MSSASEAGLLFSMRSGALALATSCAEHVPARFDGVDASGASASEILWVSKHEHGFELDNIPFRLKGLALRDVVALEEGARGRFRYRRLVQAGGHSTLWLRFARVDGVPAARRRLQALGCSSELGDCHRLLAVDVPPGAPLARVEALLREGNAAGTFEYEIGARRFSQRGAAR